MLGLKISIILFVGSLYIQLGESVKDKELEVVKYYDKIDVYLSTKVQSDDIESNFVAAKEWMNEVAKKSQKYFTLHRESKQSLKDALNQFLKLKPAIESGKCDVETIKLVDANDMAAREPRVNKSWSKGPPERRVERIVHQLAKKHYDTCYPDLISPRVDQLNPTSLKYLLALGKKLIISGTTSTSLRSSGAQVCVSVIRHFIEVEAARKGTNTENPKRDEEDHDLVTPDDYEKFIVKPCEELKTLVGEYFSTGLERRFLAYDMKTYSYDQIYYKRTAIQACAFILKNKEQVWNAMPKSLIKMKV